MADSDNSTSYLSPEDLLQGLQAMGYMPATVAAPTSNQDTEVEQSAAGTPSPEEQEMLQAATVKPGYDGSPDANPNVAIPADNSTSGVSSASPTGANPLNPSSYSAPDATEGTPSSSSTSTTPLPDFTKAAIPGSLSPAATSLSQNPELNDSALKAAQAQGNNRQLITGIGDALASVAAAPTGKAPDESFYKEQMANADQPAKNLEARRQLFERNVLVAGQTAQAAVAQMDAQNKQQLNDPNSSSSQFIKSLLASQYSQQTDAQGNKVDITKSPGWNQLSGEDALDFQKMIASQEHLQTLRDQLQFRNQTAAQKQTNFDQTQGTKQDQFDRNEQDKITKEVNAMSQSSRTAAGIAGRTLVNADRALDTLNQPTVTVQQLNNISSDIASIYNGGAATTSATQHNQYDTLYSKAQSLIQKVSGQPQDAVPDPIKSQLKDTLQSLRNISSGVAQKNFAFVQAGHASYAQKNPQYFDNLAKALSNETSPNTGQSNTSTPAQSTSTNSNYTPEVLQYAQKHNITPDQALSIKQQRTGGQ